MERFWDNLSKPAMELIKISELGEKFVENYFIIRKMYDRMIEMN